MQFRRGHWELWVSGTGVGLRVLSVPKITPTQLHRIRNAFGEKVEGILEKHREGLSLEKALRELVNYGRQKTLQMLGPANARWLTSSMRATHRDWHRTSNSKPISDEMRPWKLLPGMSELQPVLELVADEDAAFPLELLPLFNLFPDPKTVRRTPVAKEIEAHVATAMQLPAISMQTVRMFRGRVPQTSSLPNEKPLPVTAFAYAGEKSPTPLTHFERELGFIQQMAAFQGPGGWMPGIADDVVSVTERLAGELSNGRTGIVHLCCHAETTGPEAEPIIKLRANDPDAQPLNVAIADLRRQMHRSIRRRRESAQRPFVFVNACGSMQQRGQSRDSLARLLWDNGNVGFVGTEYGVADGWAADMAKLFYHYLHAQYSAPQALHLARVRLLETRNSLMGLVYCYYGPVDLRVNVPSSWSYPPVQP